MRPHEHDGEGVTSAWSGKARRFLDEGTCDDPPPKVPTKWDMGEFVGHRLEVVARCI